jgi:hypothetical protein
VVDDLKLTRTGFVSGTPLYMAPEQALGEQTDPRSDLWGLGAIMYEMCTGQTPFKGDSALAVLRQITEAKHRPLREVEPTTPDWLAEMVDELLAKKPEDRYQRATDVAEVLEFAWTQMQASSPELPGVCQVERAARRRRTRWMISGVGVGLLAVGLLAGMFLPGRMGPAARADTPVATLSADAGTVWSVAFDPSSDTLAMGVEDGSERLWNLSTKSVKSTLEAHRGIVWSSQFSPEGNYLATAGDDGLLKLWKRDEAEPFRVYQHPNAIRGLALAREGKLLYAGDRQGNLRVWSVEQDEAVKGAKQPGAIYAVALTPDGETLATAGSDKVVRLWNAKTLTPRLPLSGHAGPVNGLSFDSKGERLASVGWDQTVRLWDTSSGQLIKSWPGHPGDIWAVAFSPDGKKLATAGQEGTVKVWYADTGDLLTSFVGRHTIHALAFNQDGTQLASGGRDGAARIWRVNKGLKPLAK